MVRLANIESLAYIIHAYAAKPPLDDDDELPFGRFHNRHQASSPLLFLEGIKAGRHVKRLFWARTAVALDQLA
jgi:hypothetical protein